MTTVFFSGIVLRRNGYIRSEALVEEKSILLLPESLESSGWKFWNVTSAKSHGKKNKLEPIIPIID